MREFEIGNVVKHFKYETNSREAKLHGVYTYTILGVAHHTETDEPLVIYKANYDGRPYGLDVMPNQMFARPYDMFMSEVDHEKYPRIKQNYRFELL